MPKRLFYTSASVFILGSFGTVLELQAGPPQPTNTLYGFISSNRTLTFGPPGPTYYVVGDLVVLSGKTLTIQPGVTLRMAANRDTLRGGDYFDKTEIDVQGSLVAVAGPADSIRIIAEDGSANAWGQIKVSTGGTLHITSVDIRGPVRAIQVLGGASAIVKDCSISQCTDGVYSPYGTVALQSSELTGTWNYLNNTSIGIYAGPGVSTSPLDSLNVRPTMIRAFRWGIQSGSPRNVVVHGCEWGFYSCDFAYYCTAVYNSYGFANSRVLNSIAAQNGRGIESCTYAAYVDSWANGVNIEYTTTGPNIAAFDPFFVNPAAFNFRLADGSIFKTFSNRWLEIGAYGPGPGPPVPTRHTSWGFVKARYR